MAYELFIDGFDHYSTSEINAKWATHNGCGISSTGGRRNGGYLDMPWNGALTSFDFTLSRKVVVGFAAFIYSGSSAGLRVFFRYNSTNQFHFLLPNGSFIWQAVGGDGTVLGTASQAMVLGGWNYIECALDFNNLGSCEVRINGSSAGFISLNQVDTEHTAGALINSIYIDRYIAYGFTPMYFDDLYITYGDEIKFLGDSRVDTLSVEADTATQDWDPTYTNVPDVSVLLNANGVDGSTTFTDSSTYAYTMLAAGDAKISTEQSKFGGSSMKFDGTGDYIYLDATPAAQFGTNDFTIEMWVYTPSLLTTWTENIANLILDTRSGATTDGIIISLNAENYLTIHGFALFQTIKVPLNQWTHIAVCRNAGVASGFINGELAGSVALSRNCTSNKFTIGAPTDVRNTSATGKYLGYIDGFRITKNVALYGVNVPIPTTELTNSIGVPSPVWPLLKYKTGSISSSTVNDTSLFVMSNISHTPTNIHGLQVNLLVNKDDAGYREAAAVLDSNGTIAVGTPKVLSTNVYLARSAFVNDPDTSSAWNKSAVNNATVGVKVTA